MVVTEDAGGLPWDDDAWFDEAAAWIDARVAASGDLELLRTRPWSALISVPTADGVVWFKESAPCDAYEPALTELLAARRPDCVPRVLAAEGPRMLTADTGPSMRTLLREGAATPPWEEVVALYAELQLELAESVDELLALGVPDSRPETLGHPVHGSVPLTLIHEEVHDGNVHVRDGRPVLIDWAEASISHPFAGMTNTLRIVGWGADWKPGGKEVLRLRDAYLESWTQFAPIKELREIFAEAYALGALARAGTWDRVVEPLTGALRDEYAQNAAAWRAIYAEAREPGSKLGA
jgi:hypothetical protein